MKTTKVFAWGTIALLAMAAMPVAAQEDDESVETETLLPGVLGRAGFVIEDFVPNRVKIEATAPEKRFGPQDPLRVDVKAEEMFGQPISNKPVSGSVTWSNAPFAPAAWKGYTFGDNERKFEGNSVPFSEEMLGDDGKTSITLTPPKARPPAALQAKVQVTVTEGGRGVTRSLKRIVDPVPYYLGIKNQGDTYAKPGEPAKFEVVAVKPDGNIELVDEELTGTVNTVKWNNNLVRQGQSYVFETHRELIKVAETTVTLAGGRGTLEWTPSAVGNYLVRLSDAKSSASVSDQVYVSNDRWGRQPWSMEKPELAELVLDKKHYMAGETARLLIKAPFPGTVLLTLEQDRVLSSTVLTMTENTLEVPITLTEEMLPNVYAVASVIRPVKAEAQWLPHRAVGMVNLPVAAASRVLDIALTVPEEVRPGADLSVTAEVKDGATSAPVSGDIVVWAVDEGVLTLTDFQTPKAAKFFFAARRLMVDTADFFSKLMPELIEGAESPSATGGGDDGEGRLSPVSSERVKPVVLWQGPAKTGADGKLQIQWKVPQYMGRLRIMAMAAEGRRFGSGESNVYVRNPIMVKEHLPRFVAPGDKFTAGFTVYNNTDAAMTPSLDVSAGELLTLDQAGSQTLEAIAPRGQETVMRQVTADADRIGKAAVQFAGTAGNEGFATSVSLPVRPASPRISESGSIVVKAGESQSLAIPGGDFLPESTTVTLVAGGHPDIAMMGAFEYNFQYPYGCTEQIVSRLFPMLYLKDLARNSNPEQFSEQGLRSTVQAGIDRVLMAQTASGGLAMWIGNREPWDWASIYAGHFLTEASKAGYQVNSDYYNALLDYLQGQLSGDENATRNQLTERAYICYVMSRAGRKVQQRMEQLYDSRKKLSIEARALLAAAYKQNGLSDEARELLQVKTLANVDPTSVTRETGNILASPIRETALLLMTWLDVDPDSAETAGLAKRLMSMRRGSHWGTTQDNAFCLLALGQYARKTAAAEPVRGTIHVGGRSYDFTTSEPVTISQAELAGATADITCEGGSAYISYVAEGVPLRPTQDPVANGLSLERRYLDRQGEPVDMNALQQGQLVLVELSVTGNSQLDNVVVQDLLPAGLEIENARLASAEVVEEESESGGFVVDRMDVRDDRMLLFATLEKAEEGSALKYRYTARAVTPGEYVVPPAMLDVMYDPQVQARTAPARCTVVGRD